MSSGRVSPEYRKHNTFEQNCKEEGRRNGIYQKKNILTTMLENELGGRQRRGRKSLLFIYYVKGEDDTKLRK